MKVLTNERQSKILKIINRRGSATVDELCDKFAVSASTIRRDISELAEKKLITQIYGGAKSLKNSLVEPTMEQKSTENLPAKIIIAKYAADEIEVGDRIFIDAGTTTREMVQFLDEEMEIQVVTNSVELALLLINKKIPTIILGGEIKLSTQATEGHFAMQQLRMFNFDKSFLGVNGIDDEAGLTTPDENEAIIKKRVAEKSQETFVLGDSSKFGQVSFVKFAKKDDVTLITNSADNTEIIATKSHKIWGN